MTATSNGGTNAVILSGGGAYGAYEVGVMKALFTGQSPATSHLPLDAGVLTGTSVGSFNAAFMAMEPGVESAATIARLEAVWGNEISSNPNTCGNGVYRVRGNPFEYFEPACMSTDPAGLWAELGGDALFLAQYLFGRGANFLRSSGNLAQRTLHLFNLSSFISIEPFRQLIERIIDREGLQRSDKLVRVAATNWVTGAGKVFENQDLAGEFGDRILQASAAIPGIFAPVKIAGSTYVDGGVVMNTPLKPAIQAGATTLHVIYNDPDVTNIPLGRVPNTLDTFMRTFTTMLATIANEDIDHAAEINAGLGIIERADRGEAISDLQIRGFIRLAARIEERLRQGLTLKKLTIHRYRPGGELGGDLGLLGFDQPEILRSIARGFKDAVNHNCESCHCVLP